ncbi:imidazolonepropionase [Alteromonas sp. H39]|uniref:imidazolonepropionase n=1 Tax=Alteromonas sp. H39 TaxID=3389876 RepID=UPI0039E1A0CF
MNNLLIRNARIASMQRGSKSPFGLLEDTDIRVADGIIQEIGSDLRAKPNDTVLEANGHWCLPGFVDCHTHLVYGGDRSEEFRQRLDGVSYEEISRQGGGIKSTVRATRSTSAKALTIQTLRRARRLLEEGVTTLEIKSGYGLDEDTELKMLEVADVVADTLDISVIKTFLGAHSMPPDAGMNADEYIDFVCQVMIPKVAKEKRADAVDVFCETVGFSLEQTRRVFEAARDAGLPVKGHVEQLSDSKGAVLACEFNALSVEHIEYLQESDVATLATAGTVAVLLPGAYYYLKETQKPPVKALREAGVDMAVATDMNPGTSPIASLLTCANMASLFFGLTVEEALKGITVNGARALGLEDRGEIAPGKRADLTLWDMPSPASLIYELNGYRPHTVIAGGKHVA